MPGLLDDHRLERFRRSAEPVERIEAAARFTNSTDDISDSTSCSWLLGAAPGSTTSMAVSDQRAGSDSVDLALAQPQVTTNASTTR